MIKKTTLLFVFLVTSVLLLQAQWTQIGDDIDGEAGGDWSGQSVSLSSNGTVVAIGATGNDGNGSGSGHVRIYQIQSGIWTQIGADIDGEAVDDGFGHSVSLNSDGSVLAIGAIGNDGNGLNAGHVRVYQNQSGTWVQIGADIDGEAIEDESGYSVDLNSDGSIVAIGAMKNDGNNGIDSGHVRVYQNQSGIWTQIGADIDGEAMYDLSGNSLSLSSDGSVVAIGAKTNAGSNGESSGHVRVYQNQSGNWTQIGNDIDGEAAFDFSGISLSLSSDGSVVAIGALYNDGVNGAVSGHVRVYQNQSGIWTQIGADIDGEATGDKSGSAVSLNSDGSVVGIGAYGNEGNGSSAGHVRVYQNQSGIWTQIGVDIDGEAEGDYSGVSVSLSSDGSVVGIGAYGNGGNGINAGHVRVYNNPTLSVATIVDADFSVYPNPTDGVLFIKGDSTQKIEVIDILGRLVYTVNETNKVDLSEKEKGTYFMRFYTNRGVGIRKVMLK